MKIRKGDELVIYIDGKHTNLVIDKVSKSPPFVEAHTIEYKYSLPQNGNRMLTKIEPDGFEKVTIYTSEGIKEDNSGD